MNQILMAVIAGGVLLGGADRLFGNKFGYGEKFEEGFKLLGPTALSMAGIICLAPVLADILGRVIVPFYRAAGIDPGMFGGVLAIDMGGYQLAKELASDGRIGSYAGILVAAIFGCTLVFTIPVGIGTIDKGDRGFFAKGIMLGLAAMPVGLLAGGVAAGLSVKECLYQNLPVFGAGVFLLLGLWKIPDKMVKGFCALAEGIRILTTAGLALGAVEFLCGFNPVKGMAPLEDAMEVVASIGIVMLGSLPIAEFLRRILEKPFGFLGRKLNLTSESLTGMLIGFVSPMPVFSMYQKMDEKGKVAVGAFLVSGASLLAAHLSFTVTMEPEMLPALLIGKVCGAFAAVVLAVWFKR